MVWSHCSSAASKSRAVAVNHRDVARDDRRHRIERLREQHLLERLVEPAHRHEARHRVPVMRGRVARVELDGALELALGAGPVPVLRRAHVRERGVRFGGMAVEHHGRRRARRRLRPDVRRAEHAVVREQSVRVGQAAVRERELRVFDDRLLEEVDRLVQAFLGALIEVIAALQVEVARGQIVARPAGAGGAVARRAAPAASLSTIALGDRLPAPASGSAERHVDRLGPQVIAARAVDELRGDAQRDRRRRARCR